MNFKSNTGFFSIHFIFFVSLLSMVLITWSLVFFAQKQKYIFQQVCYGDLADLQTKIVQFEKKLFRLNSISTALRLKLKLLRIELAAALSSGNIPLVAQLSREIQNTISLQKDLDHSQKIIIQNAQAFIKSTLTEIDQQLKKTFQTEVKIWDNLINQNKHYRLKYGVFFAVQADPEGGWAPNYELSKNYQELQRLSLYLQYNFANKIGKRDLLSIQQIYELSCHVSFQRKENRWALVINQDKY